MEAKILAEAKKDIPLYFNDFKSFWDLTTANFKNKDLTDCYATTLLFKNWLPNKQTSFTFLQDKIKFISDSE